MLTLSRMSPLGQLKTLGLAVQGLTSSSQASKPPVDPVRAEQTQAEILEAMKKQNELGDQQNKLIEQQNKLLAGQNILPAHRTERSTNTSSVPNGRRCRDAIAITMRNCPKSNAVFNP